MTLVTSSDEAGTGTVGRSNSHRVVVIGAGFAGLAAARALTDTREASVAAPIEVTLVDRHNFHTFEPLLYQVATAGLDPGDVAYPVRAIFGKRPGVTFRHAEVTGIDLSHRSVRLDDGSDLAYDILIVASGAVAAYFGVPGAPERALPLYVLSDARHLRNRLLSVLESADAHPERFDGGAPTFVVIGGGPTGVETSGALVELLDAVVRRDRLRLDAARTKVTLVDMGDHLLNGFRARGSRYAEETLRRRGVDIRLGAAVASVDDGCVRLADGSELRASVVIWAGGVTVSGSIADTLEAQQARGGRVIVAPDLAVPERPEVFVVGDAAAVPDGHGGTCPQLAQVAIQSGRHAGRQIRRRLEGLPTEPFSYRDKGVMATVGRRAAVADLPRLPSVTGTIGWLAWLGLHLVYLIGFRNRAMVLMNWCWRYVDWPSGPRLILADGEPGHRTRSIESTPPSGSGPTSR
ncbi:MAG: NAD(P)/FAD-dependent oxidoreductase [Steroidobacteraceae bacterium]